MTYGKLILTISIELIDQNFEWFENWYEPIEKGKSYTENRYSLLNNLIYSAK